MLHRQVFTAFEAACMGAKGREKMETRIIMMSIIAGCWFQICVIFIYFPYLEK